MDVVLGFLSFAQGLGASVLMPILLTVLGCALGVGFGRSLRAGLTVGVGFVGLNLVITQLMGATLVPAVEEMVARFGLHLTTVDVGWPVAAAIAMGSAVGVAIIPLGLAVNAVMLATNTTQTLNVDIWNYWHFAFTGALVAAGTRSLALGFAAAVLNMVVVLVLGDATAPLVEESLGMPGVSLPHGFTVAYVPIALALNWLIDRIPVVRDVKLSAATLQRRFGVFGEPLLVGTLIGLVVGCLAYGNIARPQESLTQILTLGVSFGAVLVLIPRMATLLMEGLMPISDAASAFMRARFRNRARIYIGLDSAVGIGQPTTLAISLVLVPLCVFIAVMLPKNTVLPLADLAVIPYMFVLVTPVVHDNGFRGILIGVVILAVGLYIAGDLAPAITAAASTVGFDMGGAASVSSICDGANPLTWAIVRCFGLGPGLGLAVMGGLACGMAVWNRRRILREATELHAAHGAGGCDDAVCDDGCV